MSGFLLDTNVISELTREAPDARVMAFLNEQTDLWLSAVVIHELEFGIQLLPAGRRRERLRTAQETALNEYADRIIPLGRTSRKPLPYCALRPGGRVTLCMLML